MSEHGVGIGIGKGIGIGIDSGSGISIGYAVGSGLRVGMGGVSDDCNSCVHWFWKAWVKYIKFHATCFTRVKSVRMVTNVYKLFFCWFLFSCYYVHIMMLILSKNWNCV